MPQLAARSTANADSRVLSAQGATILFARSCVISGAIAPIMTHDHGSRLTAGSADGRNDRLRPSLARLATVPREACPQTAGRRDWPDPRLTQPPGLWHPVAQGMRETPAVSRAVPFVKTSVRRDRLIVVPGGRPQAPPPCPFPDWELSVRRKLSEGTPARRPARPKCRKGDNDEDLHAAASRHLHRGLVRRAQPRPRGRLRRQQPPRRRQRRRGRLQRRPALARLRPQPPAARAQ